MTVNHGNRLKACHTVAIAGRPVVCPDAISTKRRLPRDGSRKPRAICNNVLLPQPEGPISAVTLPGSMRQCTSLSATVGVSVRAPKVRPTLSNSMAMFGVRTLAAPGAIT